MRKTPDTPVAHECRVVYCLFVCFVARHPHCTNSHQVGPLLGSENWNVDYVISPELRQNY